VVGGPVIFTLLVWPYIVYDQALTGEWNISFYPSYLAAIYRDGVVVAERPETYIAHPTGYFDFIAVAVARVLYFLVPLRSAYSNIHNIYLLVYLVFSIFMTIRGLRVLGSYGAGGEALRFLLPLLALYYALFHSLIFVEDFRYQLPAVVAFWALAGFGVVGNNSEVTRIKNKQPSI